MHVVVVGAGFVGVSLADALVRSGSRVTLVGDVGGMPEASAVSFGWLNSHRKRPDAYQALNRAGLQVWRDRLGPRHPEHVAWGGHTVVVADPDNVRALRARVAQLQALGYPASIVPTHGAIADLAIEPAQDAIAGHFPSEGHCAPLAIREALIQDLRASGACTFVADEATAVDHDGAMLRSGRRIAADRVVIAAGNGSAALAESAGFALPLVPQHAGGAAWGLLASASAPRHGLDGVLSTDDLNLRPDGPDALIAQCLDLDRHAGPEAVVDAELEDQYADRIRRLLHRDDIAIEAVRIGHRVIPADGQTVAGPLDGTPDGRIWAVVTHSGITLAPLLSETIAAELTARSLTPLLDDFRPTRFTQSGRPSSQVPAPSRPGEQ
nr:FAD-dependent oxidoreductase [Agrococcus sp. ARC_14]